MRFFFNDHLEKLQLETSILHNKIWLAIRPFAGEFIRRVVHTDQELNMPKVVVLRVSHSQSRCPERRDAEGRASDRIQYNINIVCIHLIKS